MSALTRKISIAYSKNDLSMKKKVQSIILLCFILLLVLFDIVSVVISARSNNPSDLPHSLFFLITLLLIVIGFVRYRKKNN